MNMKKMIILIVLVISSIGLMACKSTDKESPTETVFVTANGYTVKDGYVYLDDVDRFTYGPYGLGYGGFNCWALLKYEGHAEDVVIPRYLDLSNRVVEDGQYHQEKAYFNAFREYCFVGNDSIKSLRYDIGYEADNGEFAMIFYKGALMNCSNFTTIEPCDDGIVRIYIECFFADGPLSVNGSYAFFGTRLTAKKIEVEGGALSYTFAYMTGNIGEMTVYRCAYDYAFSNCSGEIEKLILATKKQSFEYEIRANAFSNSNIKEIVLDFRHAKIAPDAFKDLNENTKVSFTGTKAELVEMLDDNNNLVNAGLKKIICSDGEILVAELYQ